MEIVKVCDFAALDTTWKRAPKGFHRMWDHLRRGGGCRMESEVQNGFRNMRMYLEREKAPGETGWFRLAQRVQPNKGICPLSSRMT